MSSDDEWRLLAARSPLDIAEDVAARFSAAGASGSEIRPAGDGMHATVVAYFGKDSSASKLLELGRAALAGLLPDEALGVLGGGDETAPQVAWTEEVRRRVGPVALTNGIWVAPPWGERPGKVTDTVIVLDPRGAFGTGHHPSTLLCALGLVTQIRRRPHPPSLLDVGTGSGILALLAAKLGASPVWGIDLDPSAVAQARHNARLNQLEQQVVLDQRSIERAPGDFDLVVANIMLDPLVAMAGELAARLAPNGAVLLAGITGDQAPALETAFREANSRFGPAEVRLAGPWALVTLLARGG